VQRSTLCALPSLCHAHEYELLLSLSSDAPYFKQAVSIKMSVVETGAGALVVLYTSNSNRMRAIGNKSPGGITNSELLAAFVCTHCREST
jgi:hypothetical protein